MFNKQLIKDFRNSTKHIFAIIKVLEQLPELEGIQHAQIHDQAQVIFAMPYDLEMFHRNREKIEALGLTWNHHLEPLPSNATVVTSFHYQNDKSKVGIHIHLEPTLPGSTCKRNLVGYEKIPVYEITCKNA